ncbi:MAG: DUF4270 domain-containing protein, partial [Bergeyella zoohelcum]|nr:DUF4270 domain-containing protein [Bergeyella zoohelcum]
LSASGFYSLLTTNFTNSPAYYDVSITQTLKDVVEKSAENKDIVLSIGDYSVSTTTGAYLGQNYNTKAYTPNRVVFVGTDATNQYRSQLNIVYTKK